MQRARIQRAAKLAKGGAGDDIRPPPFGKRTEKQARPVRPNAGIAAAYRRRLLALIDEMCASVGADIKREYARHMPGVAMDAPADALNYAIARMSEFWLRRFNDRAAQIADEFASQIEVAARHGMRSSLRDLNMIVQYRPSGQVQNAVSAAAAENAALIKSIPQRYLAQVQGAVMRSAAIGGDMASLASELQDQFGVTKRRAYFISRDQSSKTTSAIVKAQQQELGIEEAIWVHSGAGKHPRPEHVKAGRDKLRYKVDEGAYLEGVWTWPGHEINCRCTSRPVIKSLDARGFYDRSQLRAE